jgi:hypothetical protein
MVPGLLETGLDRVERVEGAIDRQTGNSARLYRWAGEPRSAPGRTDIGGER